MPRIDNELIDKWDELIARADGNDECFRWRALTGLEQARILDFIHEHFRPTKRILYQHPTSYRLKHLIEAGVGFYVSNQQAKIGMLIAGFDISDMCELNPVFNLSLKSYHETVDFIRRKHQEEYERRIEARERETASPVR